VNATNDGDHQSFDEFLLGVTVGVGHHGDLGGEAVPEGVEFAFVFAFFGAGAGRFLGVEAVGFELSRRDFLSSA
jgi:hypothetical protein